VFRLKREQSAKRTEDQWPCVITIAGACVHLQADPVERALLLRRVALTYRETLARGQKCAL